MRTQSSSFHTYLSSFIMPVFYFKKTTKKCFNKILTNNYFYTIDDFYKLILNIIFNILDMLLLDICILYLITYMFCNIDKKFSSTYIWFLVLTIIDNCDAIIFCFYNNNNLNINDTRV